MEAFSEAAAPDISNYPLVLLIGRMMMTAPGLFGTGLDQASPDVEPILRFFRAADVNADWTLSVVEFHTLLTVIMKDSKYHNVTIHESERILHRLDSWDSMEITIEQWLGLCTMETEGLEDEEEISIPSFDGVDEETLTQKLFRLG